MIALQSCHKPMVASQPSEQELPNNLGSRGCLTTLRTENNKTDQQTQTKARLNQYQNQLI
jgi:hypothetical protein